MKNHNLCLNYHDFSGTDASSSTNSKYTIDFGLFKKQLDLLSDFSNVSLTSLLSIKKSTEFSYCLTFDDGYKSSLYIAEELAKRNLKGTFFIIKNESISNAKYLTINDIKEIDRLGMEIGSHSCSHRHMNRLKKTEMIRELHESKIFLEDILSKPVSSIAFPGGHFGSREITASINEGYLLNRTCITGLNHLPLQKGIVKCVTITNQIGLKTYKDILNLSSFFFAKIKIRELALSIPKYIESKLISRKY